MAVAFVVGGKGLAKSTSVSVTVAITAGDTVLVCIAQSTSSITSITDTGGSSYSKIGSLGAVELWGTAAGAAKSSTSVTVHSSATAEIAVAVLEYSGVKSIGSSTTASGSSTAPSITRSVPSTGNFLVAALGAAASSTVSASTGTLRESEAGGSGSNKAELGAVDNTGSTSLTCTIGLSTSASWDAVAVALSPNIAVSSAATDSKSFSDSSVPKVALVPHLSDSESFSESLNPKILVSRSSSDTIIFSDSATRLVALSPAVSDALSFSDSVAGSTTSNGNHPSVAATDSFSFSETLSQRVALLRSASDAESFSETLTPKVSLSRSFSDSLSFSDLLAPRIAVSRFSSDSESFSEAPTRNLQIKAAISDTLSFSESTAIRVTLNRVSVDSVSMSESIAPRISALRSASDSVSFSESNLAQHGVSAAASDTFSVSDSSSHLLALLISLLDGSIFSETTQSDSSFHPSNARKYSYTLANLPIEMIILTLVTNPDTQAFPWSIAEYGGDVPRSALQAEMDARPLSRSVDGRPNRGYPQR